ncbi:MAG TPA: glycosyltransferase family 2 protein [Anaerolineales bacterium]|nr:glycosyltransferase family 2 protein [Anaerolineales bacterium]
MDSLASPLISLIIVCWNSGEYVSRCLESLSLQTFKNFEILIVDNGSQDKSTVDLAEKYPQLDLHVKYLSGNIGFTAANNLGAKLAQGKWLVLLNADAFPEPDWLAELIRASEEHPDIASFSSRQLVAANPSILDGAGDTYHVSGLAWRLGLGYPANEYGLESSEIFSPCAAAAMYLRQAFLDVDGFDEDFFSYFEDVDLGFRLQLQGYRCLYVPQAVVHHIGSATFGERSDFAFYHSHRNMIWTFVKNMPLKLFWFHLSEHIIANVIYLLYYALRGRGKVLLRAKWDAIYGLPKAWKKRRAIQKRRKVSGHILEKHMQHGLLQPYLLGYNLRNVLNSRSGKS